ncbi:MAG TPA: hypothetical protein VFV27_10925 [Nevskiaceae bacterium]|nr:hypothetical protein [Nevskiaceae bacterium]
MSAPADGIDLIDALSHRLARLRALAMALSDQVEHRLGSAALGEQLGSGLGLVLEQLDDAQRLLDGLALHHRPGWPDAPAQPASLN